MCLGDADTSPGVTNESEFTRMDSISSNAPRSNAPRKTAYIKDGKARFRKFPVSDKNALKGKRYCPECENVLDVHLFTSRNSNLYTYCKECRNKKERTRYTSAKGRETNLRRNYGITQEQYDLMVFQQGGVCAICKQPETLINGKTKRVQLLAVDHNHETGEVRELLCNTCNYLVGYCDLDRERVKNVLKYLKKHDS